MTQSRMMIPENDSENKRPLYIPYAGPILLDFPLLNKGSAFSEDERNNFNLHGLLPERIETIEEQSARAYRQFLDFSSDIDRHIYLRNIQDTNETLFYRLLDSHLEEMMPIIYTPTVGEACERFSDIYRRARGLIISWPNRDRIDDLLQNATRQDVKVIVVTDGERILGLGDQGIGGMGIPIGKLSLYSACGGISPAHTLPIVLDAGTNNQQKLNDPFYMGWRHERVTGAEYDAFVDEFIQAVNRRWPNVLLQFEDFAQSHAMPLLNRYRDKLCCFNDDIQGTAAVTLGSLMAASRAAGRKLSEETVVFVGAGSAGCGIAEQIVSRMVQEGLSDSQARSRVLMVDRDGLLLDDAASLQDFQRPLAQPRARIDGWPVSESAPDLLTVITHAKPTILIGVSGQPGLFTREIIQEMYRHCRRPVVMPLTNPTSRVEAVPQDIIEWTDGAALVATGSPFSPVSYQGREIPIAQCNNAYIFPGVGLGVLAAGARRITQSMFQAASGALADCSPMASDERGSLLPAVQDIQRVSRYIAFAVAKEAQAQGVAVATSDEAIWQAIDSNYWQPQYRRYKRISY